MDKLHTYLALGDSYTVGESVLLHQNFPYLLAQRLRKQKLTVAAPEIIARTGWTTDELKAAMEGYSFLGRYDLVTLLAGVNNQYRGRTVEDYKAGFEDLLQQAIILAGGKGAHVVVLSIPDYSVTNFAAGMDREKITHEIDLYNSVNHALSIQYKTKYLDVTGWSREAAGQTELFAEDGLHPSTKEYSRWAEAISDMVSHLKE